jgi:hypothetical protein
MAVVSKKTGVKKCETRPAILAKGAKLLNLTAIYDATTIYLS